MIASAAFTRQTSAVLRTSRAVKRRHARLARHRFSSAAPVRVHPRPADTALYVGVVCLGRALDTAVYTAELQRKRYFKAKLQQK